MSPLSESTEDRSSARRRRLVILVAIAAVVLWGYLGGLRLYRRWAYAVMVGKSPKSAYATVIRKEHVRLPVSDVSGGYVDERFYIYYRIDDFGNLDSSERNAVLKAEQSRFAKEGPRREELGKDEFDRLSEGAAIKVLYAYYPNVLWGTSDDIRIPW